MVRRRDDKTLINPFSGSYLSLQCRFKRTWGATSLQNGSTAKQRYTHACTHDTPPKYTQTLGADRPESDRLRSFRKCTASFFNRCHFGQHLNVLKRLLLFGHFTWLSIRLSIPLFRLAKDITSRNRFSTSSSSSSSSFSLFFFFFIFVSSLPFVSIHVLCFPLFATLLIMFIGQSNRIERTMSKHHRTAVGFFFILCITHRMPCWLQPTMTTTGDEDDDDE